jgi:hypothetical protein
MNPNLRRMAVAAEREPLPARIERAPRRSAGRGATRGGTPMGELVTQTRIDAVVARAAAQIRRTSANPERVRARSGTPERAAGTVRPDGWRDVGTVVDGAGERAYLVRWHPVLRLSQLVWRTRRWTAVTRREWTATT